MFRLPIPHLKVDVVYPVLEPTIDVSPRVPSNCREDGRARRLQLCQNCSPIVIRQGDGSGGFAGDSVAPAFCWRNRSQRNETSWAIECADPHRSEVSVNAEKQKR